MNGGIEIFALVIVVAAGTDFPVDHRSQPLAEKREGTYWSANTSLNFPSMDSAQNKNKGSLSTCLQQFSKENNTSFIFSSV